MNNQLARLQSKFCISLVLIAVFNPIVQSQMILIDQLMSLSSIDSEITKRFSFLQNEQLSGISVFGWIRLNQNNQFGKILKLISSNTELELSRQSQIISNTLFCLNFLNWDAPKLLISSYQNNLEEKQSIDLLTEEYNNLKWIFIYLGHSFTDSKQTYYKYSFSNPLIIFTKEVQQFESQKFFQLSAGIGKFNEQQYFIGDIVRLSITFGNRAYREKNFHELHIWQPEAMPPCTVVFTECAYTGEGFDLCEGPSKKPVKSVILSDTQEQVYVCLGNKQIKILKNVECLEEGNWIEQELNGMIKLESLNNNQCED